MPPQPVPRTSQPPQRPPTPQSQPPPLSRLSTSQHNPLDLKTSPVAIDKTRRGETTAASSSGYLKPLPSPDRTDPWRACLRQTGVPPPPSPPQPRVCPSFCQGPDRAGEKETSRSAINRTRSISTPGPMERWWHRRAGNWERTLSSPPNKGQKPQGFQNSMYQPPSQDWKYLHLQVHLVPFGKGEVYPRFPVSAVWCLPSIDATMPCSPGLLTGWFCRGVHLVVLIPSAG